MLVADPCPLCERVHTSLVPLGGSGPVLDRRQGQGVSELPRSFGHGFDSTPPPRCQVDSRPRQMLRGGLSLRELSKRLQLQTII
jgi:hypothetical protein